MRHQPLTLTDDHVWIINTLSDALSLNEMLCLNLLVETDEIYGLQGRTREDTARLAAGVYHEERMAVVECLLLILNAAIVDYAPDRSELQSALADYAVTVMRRTDPAEGGGSTLLRRLLALASAEPPAVEAGSLLEHITLRSGVTCARADQAAHEAMLCANALHSACSVVAYAVHTPTPVAVRVEDAMAVVRLAAKRAADIDAEEQKRANARALNDEHIRVLGRGIAQQDDAAGGGGLADSNKRAGEREEARRKAQQAVSCQLAAVELLCPCDQFQMPMGVVTEPNMLAQVGALVRAAASGGQGENGGGASAAVGHASSSSSWHARAMATTSIAWALASADPRQAQKSGEAADVIARYSAKVFAAMLQGDAAARYDPAQGAMAHQTAHKLLLRFLLHEAGKGEVRAMRDAASVHVAAEGGDASEGAGLASLLSLMAVLYAANPGLAEHWCVVDFVEGVMEDQCTVAMLTPLLDMLAALAGSDQWRPRLREWLQRPADRVPVNWSKLFNATAQYASLLRAREQEQGGGVDVAKAAQQKREPATTELIPAEDERVLTAYLSLFRSLFEAAAEDSERQAVAQEIRAASNQAPVVGLVSLYTCGVSPALKASLLDALRAAALSPSLAHAALEQLKSSGAAHAHAGGAAAGLTRQLNQIEAPARTYPELRAFLRLVKTLAASLPLYADRGLALRTLLPFVRDEAFLKLGAREHVDPAERWEVAALCLEIFESVVAVYAPRAQDFHDGGVNRADVPPGFDVMKDALSGGAILHHALQILVDGGEVPGDRALAPLDLPRERAVHAALALLRTVLGADAEVCRCAAEVAGHGVDRDGADSRGLGPAALLTLDVVLTRAPERLAACMQYCAYTPNVAVRCAAVDVMRHLSDRLEGLPLALGDGAPARRIVGGCAAALAEAVASPPQTHEGAEQGCDAYQLGLRVLSLMLSAASQPAPNMLHFLLGCQCSVDGIDLPEASAVRQLAPLLHLCELVCDTGRRETHATRLAELAVRVLASLATEEQTRGAVLHALRQRGLVARMVASSAAAPPPAEGERQATLTITGSVLRLAAIELHAADPEVPLQGGSIASVLRALFGAAADSGSDPSALQALSSRHVALLQILEQLRPSAPPVASIGAQDAAVESVLAAAHVREALADPRSAGIGGEAVGFGAQARPTVDLKALTHFLQSRVPMQQTPRESAASADANRLAIEVAASNNAAAEESAARASALLAWAAAVEVLVSRRIDGAGNTLKLVDMVLHACLDVLLDASRKAEVDNDLAGSLLRVVSVTLATLSAAHAETRRGANAAAAGALSRHAPTELATVASGALPKLLLVMGDASASAGSGAGSVVAMCRLYAGVLHALDCADGEAAACAAVRRAPEQALARLASDALAPSEALQELALRTLDAALAADAGGTTVERALSAGVIRGLLHGVAGAGGRAAAASLTNAAVMSTRPACLLEAQLSLLLRIAISRWPVSAEVLLRTGALRSLAACEALDVAVAPFSQSAMGLDAARAAAVAVHGRGRADRAMRRTIVFPALRLAAAVGASLPKSEDCGAQLANFVSSHVGLFASTFATAALPAARDTGDEALADSRVARAAIEDAEELALCMAVLLPLYAHAVEAGGAGAAADARSAGPVAGAIARVHNDVVTLAGVYCTADGALAVQPEVATRLQAVVAALASSRDEGQRAAGATLRAQMSRASDRLAQCVRLGPAMPEGANGHGTGAMVVAGAGAAGTAARVAEHARASLVARAADGMFAYVGGGMRSPLA